MQVSHITTWITCSVLIQYYCLRLPAKYSATQVDVLGAQSSVICRKLTDNCTVFRICICSLLTVWYQLTSRHYNLIYSYHCNLVPSIGQFVSVEGDGATTICLISVKTVTLLATEKSEILTWKFPFCQMSTTTLVAIGSLVFVLQSTVLSFIEFYSIINSISLDWQGTMS